MIDVQMIWLIRALGLAGAVFLAWEAARAIVTGQVADQVDEDGGVARMLNWPPLGPHELPVSRQRLLAARTTQPIAFWALVAGLVAGALAAALMAAGVVGPGALLAVVLPLMVAWSLYVTLRTGEVRVLPLAITRARRPTAYRIAIALQALGGLGLVAVAAFIVMLWGWTWAGLNAA